ncbi:MAG: hypothetical protein KIS68_03045 [Bauldia sp.]|nr:hypothetical protein [Bauldia sp.]
MKFPTGSSLGFFGVFGRSSDLRQIDEAFRALDVHPKTVPEPVKLAMSRFIKDATSGEPPPEAYRRAAELVGYCVIGANPFAGANGEALTDDVERRMEQALRAGTSVDAQLVLLALHAKIIQPSVVDAFDLEAG